MTAVEARTGARTRDSGRPLVLVVGHAATLPLGGGERSLVDVLDHMSAAGLDTMVVLPPDPDPGYRVDLLDRTTALIELPVPRRCPSHPPDENVIERYRSLIRTSGAAAVHVNTIVPREPLIAARREGIPAVVHAREVADGDPRLQEWLGASSADEVTRSVLDEADYVIANSRFTANHYPLSGRTSVVSPVADPQLAAIAIGDAHPLRVSLIGTVTEKKGVRDLLAVARLLSHRTDIVLQAIGPRSRDVDEINAEGWPSNARFLGPTATPAEAMEQTDVVLCLSHCNEGFGRTLLEAMAAGRPVIAYSRGAVAELVVPDVTGFLVEPGDVTAVAHIVERIADEPGLRQQTGASGRERAFSLYSSDQASAALQRSYAAIIPEPSVVAASADDSSIPIPQTNRTAHSHPYYVGNRARFATCTAVRFISGTRLAAASLLGCTLHLLEFDPASGEGRVISTVESRDSQGTVSVELLDFDGVDRVVTANSESHSVSLYRIVRDTLEFEFSVPLPEAHREFCHGVSFVPGRPDLVCISTNTGRRETLLLSLSSGEVVSSIGQAGWGSKATAFLSSHRFLSMQMTLPVGQDPRTVHSAQISLIKVRGMRVLDQLALPGRTLDGCSTGHGLLVAASQAHDSVLVVSVEEDRLELLDELRGFSFPHDAHVSPDGSWLAVACYGTSDVRLRRLPEPLIRSLAAPATLPWWRTLLR